jgi:hypothetical protein
VVIPSRSKRGHSEPQRSEGEESILMSFVLSAFNQRLPGIHFTLENAEACFESCGYLHI